MATLVRNLCRRYKLPYQRLSLVCNVKLIAHNSNNSFVHVKVSAISSLSFSTSSLHFMVKSTEGIYEKNHVSHKVLKYMQEYHSNLNIEEENVHGACKLFLDRGFKSDKLEEAFCSPPPPPILLQPLTLLRDVLIVFSLHKIPKQTVLQSLTAYDMPFDMEPSELDKRLLYLRKTNIEDVTLLRYLEICPFLIYVSGRADNRNCPLTTKLIRLKAIFPPPELKHLLFNYPGVLLEPWENIENKIMYIFKEMGLDQPHMAHCKILSHPLPHIINRHQLLVRLGLYTKPKLFRDRLSHLVNAKLEHIMDTTDREFCKRVAKISLGEFEVFKALLAEERGENLEGIALDALDDADDDDEAEFEESLLQSKLSYRQMGLDAPPSRGPLYYSTGEMVPTKKKP